MIKKTGLLRNYFDFDPTNLFVRILLGACRHGQRSGVSDGIALRALSVGSQQTRTRGPASGRPGDRQESQVGG